MQSMNINKLKGKMVERGITVSDLAEKLGINTSTLYRKFSNDGDTMLICEANRIVQILGLTSEEAVAIFFAQSVA